MGHSDMADQAFYRSFEAGNKIRGRVDPRWLLGYFATWSLLDVSQHLDEHS